MKRVLYWIVLCATLSCSSQAQKISVLEIPPTKKWTKPFFFPKKYLIVIDPGHGGKDTGTKMFPQMVEKELNLKTAKLVSTYLKKMGAHVTMTRSDDTFLSLQQRVQMANTAVCDLFISIHYNSAPNPLAEGTEIFYPRKAGARAERSKKLAEHVLQHMIKITGAESRGVKHQNLAVIRDTAMPAILIECGFLTNRGERERIAQEEYLKKIAQGIALGIQQFYIDSKR